MEKSQKYLLHMTEQEIYEKVARSEITLDEALHLFEVLNTQQSLRSAPSSIEEENVALQDGKTRDAAAIQEALESYLCHTLEVFLNLPEQAVDKEENFMALGADSTNLVELTKKVEEEFSIELYPTLFFEYQNIRELAGYLCTTFPDALVDRFPNQFGEGPSTPQTEQEEPTEFPGDVQHREPPNSPASYSAPEPRAQAVQQVYQTEEVEPLPYSGGMQAQEDIAVIGMSGIFPGSPDLHSFWNNLAKGKDLISEIPGDHFDWQPWFDPKAQVGTDAIYCKWGGFLSNVGMFDAAFFNISPREAEMMDPQLRLLLQVLYHTAEDAGYGQRIRGSHTGMFVGVSGHSYLDEMARLRKAVVPHQGTGNTASMIANRPSFCLDLTGPSLAVDTACSSSLVALHLACTALQRQECDQAFAAGTNLLLSSWHYRYYSSISALSRSGRCHTFDSRADGYVPAEGVGAVLLKPLSKARADNDRIHAVIKGSAVNHGGMTQSVTAPGVRQEAEVLLAAWKDAGIDPATIGYIEAHGTGTALGDPIEIRALHKAFRKHTEKEHFCALGSAKAHIGHAEAAAGIAGVIKTILSMQHKLIPAMPEFRELNPYIQLEHGPVYINREAQSWTSPDGIPRRAGVSSFGFGGAYAHIVLEEYSAMAEAAGTLDDTGDLSAREMREEAVQLLLLSAQSEERLRMYVQRLADFLQTDEGGFTLRDLAYTLQVGREGLAERVVIKASSLDDACEQLRAYSRGEKERMFSSPKHSESGKRKAPDAAELLVEGRAGQAFLHILLEDREWDKLARLWTGGIGIDWGLLYTSPLPRLLSLPGYPFEEQRYWFDQTIEQEGQGGAVISTASPAASRTADSGDVAGQEKEQEDILNRLRKLLSLLLKKSAVDINPQVSLLEMGADSIIIMQLVQQVEVLFGQKISVRQIFQELQTLDNLVAYLHHHASASSGKRHTDDAVHTADPADQGIEHHQPVPSRSIDACSSDSVCKPNISPGTSSAWSTALQADDQEPLTPQQEEHLQQLIMRYTARTAESKRHEAAYRAGFADMRSAIGFRQQTKELCYPIVAQASSGSKITDLDGNEYIDLTMGFGSALFGHKPRFIIKALETQLQRGIQVGPQSDAAGALASDLCKLTGMDRVTFCNSGTEAVMTALRIARAATGRSKIVLFTGSYHGHFDGTLAVASGDSNTVQPMAAGVLQNMIRDVLILPYGTPDSLAAIEDCAHELAAVLVEPVQSRKPDLQPKEFLLTLREITRSAGSLLIFDEMITGFRIHPGGAQAWFDIEADLTTYGKIIGGGMPIGVVAGRAPYMAHIDGGLWNYGDASAPTVERTFYAGTFCKHPLAMVAAQAVVRHLHEQGPALQEGLNEQTSALVEELNTWFMTVRVPLRVVHFGSLFRFVLTGNFSYVYQPIEMELFFYHLIAKGIYVWELRTCFLSTAHTDEDIKHIVNAVKESVKELQKGGFFPSSEKPVQFIAPAEMKSQSASAVKENGGIPLTDAQKQLWVLANMDDEGSLAYNLYISLQLKGTVHLEAMRQAVRQVIDRHEALRTVISPDGEVQKYSPSLPIDLLLIDFSEKDSDERESRLTEWFWKESKESFDLSNGPLFRVHLIKLSGQEYILALAAHHIFVDGWSMGIILSEIFQLYSIIRQKKNEQLTPPGQWREYIAEQLQEYRNSSFVAHEAYWLEQFSGSIPVLNLPADHPHLPIKTYKANRQSISFDAHFSQTLKKFSRTQGCTLFMTLLSVYLLLLHRLSGQDDIVVGTPVSGRFFEGSENLVGYAAHLLPIRSQLKGNPAFFAYLKQLKNILLESYEHKAYPYARLINKLSVRKDTGSSALVNTTFNLERPVVLPKPDEVEVTILPQPISYTAFDIQLNVTELDNTLIVDCNYNTELFETATILRWLGHFQTLLESVVKEPDLPIFHLPLLTESEQEQILVDWNATQTPHPHEVCCIHRLIEAQVEKTPEAVAVVFEEQQVSYRTLNQRANQLAHYLLELGVQPETLVGICIERSIDMIVGMLAVLKAGGAYVPLDPDDPEERLAFLLEDSQVQILLAQSALKEKPFSLAVTTIYLDLEGETLSQKNDENTPAETVPENLAYVIYTSGSTGRPKGVAVEHRSLFNYVHAISRYFDESPRNQFALLTPITADAGHTVLFPSLLTGGCLHVLSRETLSLPEHFANYISTHSIDYIKIIPSLLASLLDSLPAPVLPRKLLVLGGEASHTRWVKELLENAQQQQCDIINHYGPTETTVGVLTYDKVDKDTLTLMPSLSLPIGRPLANVQVYILDAYLQPTPVGVPGELHVGGISLARGYVNRPDLTEEKFIKNPFSRELNSRLYKTGDLARYLPDGNIEFLGRIDNQVKIRGFRIEVNEIEAVLGQHPAVLENAVVVSGEHTTEKCLVAYIVPVQGADFNKREFRHFLREHLPDYMIPAAWTSINALPLMSNGKLDRQALAALNAQPLCVHEAEYVAPRNPTEETLVQFWEEVLQRHPVGIYDNFFDLGGHSLKAAQLISRIQKHFSRKIPFRIFFTAPSVADLATQLAGSTELELPPIESIPKQEHYALSSAQYRIWTAEQMHEHSIAYNMTGAVLLTGIFDAAACEQAFTAIITRHESLRTGFVHIAGEPRQLVHPAPAESPAVELLDRQDLEDGAEVLVLRLLEEEIRFPFDLRTGPLLRIRLVQLRPDRNGQPQHILLVNMHHIISDGVSVTNITQEFAQLYQAVVQGKQADLPPLRIQYKDYAAWQDRLLAGEYGSQLKAYWQEVFADVVPVLRLPTDHPRPEVRSQSGSMLSFTIGPDLLHHLQKLARQQGASLFTVLLSAVEVLFFHAASQEDIVVGVPVAGRNHPSFEQQIGFYVNILPVKVRFRAEDSFTKLLSRVTEAAADAYAHQDYPFEQLVEDLGVQPEQGRHPLFDVLVNMPLQQPVLDLPGLTARFQEHSLTSKMDLQFIFNETREDTLELQLEYSTDLFHRETVSEMGEALLLVLHAVAAHPDQTLIDLRQLSISKEQAAEHSAFLSSAMEMDEEF